MGETGTHLFQFSVLLTDVEKALVRMRTKGWRIRRIGAARRREPLTAGRAQYSPDSRPLVS